MKISKKQSVTLLFLLVAARLLIMFQLDAHTYWTFDEPWNTETAKQVINEGQFRRTKDSFTPIAIANVFVGQKLMKIFPGLNDLTSYRITGIVLNQASVPLSYAIALELGATESIAVLFAVFLGFDPNILGHTILASNVDGYIFTWFLLLAWVAFLWARKRDLPHMGLFGLVVGLAQGVKLTSAYAVPLCLIWIIFVFWRNREAPIPFLKGFGLISFFLLNSWFGLCLFYAFNKIGMPFGEIHFVSQPFQSLASHFSWLPTFLPVDYLQGLDMCLKTDASPRPVYIRNEFLLHGVPYYFLYVLLLKTPLPLLVSAPIGWVQVARRRMLGLTPVAFLILFNAVMMIYFSFFFNAQIGIRYLFPIYAFLFAGTLWFPWKKTSVVLSLLWLASTSFYNWPNDIGYFNELVSIKHHRWWHLGDSNLTWNQEWKDWPNFIAENHLDADRTSPPTFPLEKSFYEDAITVSGILWNRDQLGVLRDHFAPYDSFWGVKLLYKITSPEILKEFPPIDGPEPRSISSDCKAEGWSVDQSDQTENGFLFAQRMPKGQHQFSSSFILTQRSPVFFELSSKSGSELKINDFIVLESNDSTPRLNVKTLNLNPGTYDMNLDYNRIWDDGFISIRAYELSRNGGEAKPVKFCVRHSGGKK